MILNPREVEHMLKCFPQIKALVKNLQSMISPIQVKLDCSILIKGVGRKMKVQSPWVVYQLQFGCRDVCERNIGLRSTLGCTLKSIVWDGICFRFFLDLTLKTAWKQKWQWWSQEAWGTQMFSNHFFFSKNYFSPLWKEGRKEHGF